MNYKINAIEYYVPDVIIDNDFLEKESGIDRNFTENKVGIKERRIAKSDETTSDMSAKACKILFENNPGIDKEKIDLLIVCTQNPDYRLPTTACMVQDKVGLAKSTKAFDINLGCSGFVYALEVAGNFLRTETANEAIIVMADEYSKLIDYKDKNTASIFGDAAAAIHLTKCPDGYGTIATDFGTDGSGWDKLIAWNSGVAKNPDKNNSIFMDGRQIFAFSMMTVPKSINNVLKKADIKISDIKHVIFHQANQYMIRELKKRMKLTDIQTVIFMENIGNTISATIPIALKEILKDNKVKKDDYLLFSGFGVGLSWGTILYKFI